MEGARQLRLDLLLREWWEPPLPRLRSVLRVVTNAVAVEALPVRHKRGAVRGTVLLCVNFIDVTVLRIIAL